MSAATDQYVDVLPGVPAGTWEIDSVHSTVAFAVRHLMSKVRGSFREFGGRITIGEDRLRSATQVEIALASVTTGNEFRDNHLRTGEFLDVAEHPTMTFTSTGLHESGGSWVLDGDLTIRDTTRPVRIELEYLGYDPTGTQGEARVGFAGRTSINRSDYGIGFGLAEGGKVVVGDTVEILLEIEAVLLDQ